MVVFAGQGDPDRSMELLWRAPPPADVRPGPKPGLTVDVIVTAAIAVADNDGMDALSMRAVGEGLGRTAMALYTYVPGKRELIDLMYDQVHGELPNRYPTEDGWRPAVTAWAHDHWEFCLRHPWVLRISPARPVLGPHEFASINTLTALLCDTGLPARTLRGIVGTLSNVVRGSAQVVAEARAAKAETGQPDDEWWQARAGRLATLAPDLAERFPAITWLETESATDPRSTDEPYLEANARQAFESGLAVLLDGIAAAIDSRR